VPPSTTITVLPANSVQEIGEDRCHPDRSTLSSRTKDSNKNSTITTAAHPRRRETPRSCSRGETPNSQVSMWEEFLTKQASR